ncbi:hypothetical protein COX25_00525 [bacterium (Candidatus Howlettbacteria) CG23_combo_of_CG06-09_8_20_14_all_37_9]|nr:MAG: hypothetical protein COX25_00525 [bacterium (Candidatus Howlettbacteria) CG23_combo_of_CG06-09_8_20_14_all_37_9]
MEDRQTRTFALWLIIAMVAITVLIGLGSWLIAGKIMKTNNASQQAIENSGNEESPTPSENP